MCLGTDNQPDLQRDDHNGGEQDQQHRHTRGHQRRRAAVRGDNGRPKLQSTFQVACSTDLSGNLRVLASVSDGTNPITPQVCTLSALINTSASGATQIVALSGSKVIRICHISFSTVATEDVKLVYGTGSNCGTGTNDLTGLYKTVQSFDFEYAFGSPLKAPAAQAICFNQSVAQAAGVTVVYGID